MRNNFRKIITVPGRLLRIIRQEGISGILVRLYYPKRTSDITGFTPPCTLPLHLSGKTGSIANELTHALNILGIKGNLHCKSSTLHIDPCTQESFNIGDALLFTNRTAVNQFAHKLKQLPATSRCNGIAVLVPDTKSLETIRACGIMLSKIFIMPSLLSLPAKPQDPYKDLLRDLAGDLARWLIAAGSISAKEVSPDLFPALRDLSPGTRICLSLPETVKRREHFISQEQFGFRIFNGIRRSPGWKGCGASYAMIAQAAIAQNAAPLVVCEDDILPPDGFARHLENVESYLSNTEWDVFSGLLTNISDDYDIHKVEHYAGLTFVHVNFTTGMVFNIYNQRALERLAIWSPKDNDIQSNAVDVWLGSIPGLRAITTIPFLAGHNPDLDSTVFGFSSRRYKNMIQASEKRLMSRIAKINSVAQIG